MKLRRLRRAAVCSAVPLMVLLGPPPGSAAPSTMPSPVHTWTGDQAGEGYGWAVSELRDVDGDGATDAIIGAPFHATAAGSNAGHVDVRSGRSGAVLHSYVGLPGELLGYAIADAGDVDGDGVHDVVIGAPQGGLFCTGTEAGPGQAYVRSGATGALLLTLGGAPPRAHLGAAVASAGDIDGDGHADVLVGALRGTLRCRKRRGVPVFRCGRDCAPDVRRRGGRRSLRHRDRSGGRHRPRPHHRPSDRGD